VYVVYIFRASIFIFLFFWSHNKYGVYAIRVADWCFVEACGVDSYDFTSSQVPSVEQLVAMQQCSPVRHIDRVVAPTLMYLGAKDRRVPYSQL